MKDSRKEGVGTLIAAVFMILILVAGVGVYFLVLGETERYHETLEDMQYLDWERGREDIAILSDPSPFAADNTLDISVINRGSVEARLIWLAVFDPLTHKTPLPYTRIDVLVGPQEVVSGIGSNIEEKFIGGQSGTRSFHIQLISERGSITNLEYPELRVEEVTYPSPSEFGYLQFYFSPDSFEFTSFPNHPTPTSAWTIPFSVRQNGEPILFWVKFRNIGVEDITILNYSTILVLPVKQGSFVQSPFWIVDINSEAGNLTAYDPADPVIIVPNKIVTVKFGSANYGSDGNETLPAPPGAHMIFWTFLVIHYDYGGVEYGQTIPFPSIRYIEG